MAVTKNYLKDNISWFECSPNYDTVKQTSISSVDIVKTAEFVIPKTVTASWNAAKDGGTIMCYEVPEDDTSLLKLYIVGDNICTQDAQQLFYMFTQAKKIEGLHNIDFSETSNLFGTFYHCESITQLDVSSIDVSHIISFNHAFCGCHNLHQLDVGSWKNSVAQDVNAMFNSCQFEYVDLRGFDTSNVYDFEQMFEHCTNLKRILGIEKFNTSSATSFFQMFAGCRKLRELDLSSFTTSNVEAFIRESPDKKSPALAGMFMHCHSLYKIKSGQDFKYIFPNNYTSNELECVLDYFLPSPLNLYKEPGYCMLYDPVKSSGDGYHSYVEGADLAPNGDNIIYSADQAVNIGIYYDSDGNQYTTEYIRDTLLATPRDKTITLFANKYGRAYNKFDDAMEELSNIVREKTGFTSKLDIGNIVSLVSKLPSCDVKNLVED